MKYSPVNAVRLAGVVAGAAQLLLQTGADALVVVVVADGHVQEHRAALPDADVNGQTAAGLLVDVDHALVDAVRSGHWLQVELLQLGGVTDGGEQLSFRSSDRLIGLAVCLIGWRLENGLRFGEHKVIGHARVDGVDAGFGGDLEGRVHLNALSLVPVGDDGVLVAVELHLQAHETA